MKQSELLVSVLMTGMFADGVIARPPRPNLIDSPGRSSNYRARRYGNYHSTTYFSYSGNKGYARYSRIYNTKKNKYRDYYFKMFDWFKTEEFRTYQDNPAEYVSVCRNYEADSNGTYIGIFTCPLPIYPTAHTYCCGVDNAEYCCQFWDIPQNVLACLIVTVMGGVILSALGYIVCLLKRTERIRNTTMKRKKSFFRKKHLVEIFEEMSKKHKNPWTNPKLFRKSFESNYDLSDRFQNQPECAD